MAVAVGGLLALSLRGGSSHGTAFAPIAQAAERTANSAGARMSGTGTVSGTAGTIQMSFDGVFSGRDQRSLMHMRITSPPEAASAMGEMTEIGDGLTFYMSMPIFAGELPGGATWMKIDLSDFAPDAGQTSSVDAGAMLDSLRAVAPGGARTVGTERVRGVRTTHYAASIDPGLQAAQLRDQGDDLAAELIEAQGAPTAVDVWVDAKSMVRRMATTIPFSVVGGEGATMQMTLEFYDFGIKPAIELPPSDQVFDGTELAKQGVEAALGD